MNGFTILLKKRKGRKGTVIKRRKHTPPIPCKKCGRLVVWGTKNGPHPFNALVNERGYLRLGLSHELTCVHSDYDTWLPPAVRERLRKEDYQEAWRMMSRIEQNKFFQSNFYDNPKNFWRYVALYNPPSDIADEITERLVDHGGPYAGERPRSLLDKIMGIAMLDRLLLWVFVHDALYACIYELLYVASVPVDTPRKEVFVHGYQIEPMSLVPDDFPVHRNFMRMRFED